MKIHIGIIGLGYWGPNFVRNIIRHPLTEIYWACDVSEKALQNISQFYPQLKVTKNYKDILDDNSIALVIIVTPPETHYKIAKAALEANKHVVVAKPIATTSSESIQLLRLAKKKKLLLFGDLTYLYTGAVDYIKNTVKNGDIGIPLYYDSIRSNLGLIQKEVNVIWDLAPHDFAILDYCFGLKPLKVFATASKHYGNSKNQEMAHITVTYSNNFIAHIHISWISPVKLRTILIGGTKKMISFDDVQPDEKLKIYDKGISISTETITPITPLYRNGNIVIPKLKSEEALFLEIGDIAKQIINKKLDYSNANMNIQIIKLLEACDKSIKLGKAVTFING